jgi:hypothetical protein
VESKAEIRQILLEVVALWERQISAEETVKKHIATKFKVEDAGEATYLLGVSIRRERSAGKLWA